MKNALKHIFYLVAIFLLVSSLLILFFGPEQKPDEVNLTQLATLIKENQIKTIDVEADNTLNITKNDQSEENTEGTKLKSRKEPDSSITETLIGVGVTQDELKKIDINIKSRSTGAVIAQSALPFLIPAIIIIALIWFMMRSASRGNNQALSFGLSKARIIDPKDNKKKTTFKDVAGNKEAKEEFEEVVEFLRNPKVFLDMGAKIPKGVLLLGPPGTGKTLMAKAVAGEANVPFFNISGSEFVEMFVGVGASRVRDLFKQAKKNAPAIIFVDEIDAVGRHRGAGLGGGHDEREQTLNQILVEMDGFETDTNVIVIAATNRPDVLDPALLRPGRFDRRVTMDLPDIEDRIAILNIHAKNKPIGKKVNLRRIAQRTVGFSGADLANLLNESAILAARRKKKIITMLELIDSIEKVMLGPERKSKKMNEREKKIVAYHEGGHALVGASLKHADPVQKVSIISRGHAGGYTMSVPQEDKHLYNRSFFIDQLSVLLGGYVAEEMIFGDITTGPSSDLERATSIARNIVTRYGMSSLGPRTFGKKEDTVFLGREVSEEKNYSEKTADEIDKEVSKLIADAKQVAKEVLTTKKEILEKIANTLLEQETIEKEQFDAIVEGKEYTPVDHDNDEARNKQKKTDAPQAPKDPDEKKTPSSDKKPTSTIPAGTKIAEKKEEKKSNE